MNRERIILDHMSLVKKIAYRLSGRYCDHEDVVSAGMVGLIQCADKFDPDKNASFVTFAWRRIRGAMFDEIKKPDVTFVDIDDLPLADSRDFLNELIIHNASQQIQKAMARLTDKQRFVLCKYFFEDLTMREIGELIGRSESAVSLVYTAAIRRLRKLVISRL